MTNRQQYRQAVLFPPGIIVMSIALGHLPEFNLPPPGQRNHAAVIYFAHSEPPAYSPMPWIETFKELDLDGYGVPMPA